MVEVIMEQFVTDNPGIAVTVLRPCFVVGPGFNNIMAQNLRKNPILMPATLAPMQFVHEDDLAEIIVKCLERKLAGVYNVAADGTMTVADMADLLRRKLVQIPDWLINMVNSVGWKMNIPSISLQPNTGIDMVRYPWIVSNDKLKKALDYKYSKDSREAFSDFAEYVMKEDRKTNGR
jgi:UDP-glucose 4-epimerase